MKIKKSLLLPLILLTFIFTPVVFAATSGTFFPSAQKFINNTCAQKNITQNQLGSLYCYLFYKVKEQDVTLANHESRITNLEATVTPIPGQIAHLQNQISSDEAEINNLEKATSSSTMKTVIFANNRPQPFNSDWVDVRGGFDTLTLTLSITGSISDYGIQFTNDPANATDQTGFTAQTNVQCNNQSSCPVTTIPILGDYYRISTGTANGNVTATGVLKKTNGFAPDKIVNVCFNVANGSIRVLQAVNCGSDVQWKIPVQCVAGAPCKPDNPNDGYYLNNN